MHACAGPLAGCQRTSRASIFFCCFSRSCLRVISYCSICSPRHGGQGQRCKATVPRLRPTAGPYCDALPPSQGVAATSGNVYAGGPPAEFPVPASAAAPPACAAPWRSCPMWPQGRHPLWVHIARGCRDCHALVVARAGRGNENTPPCLLVRIAAQHAAAGLTSTAAAVAAATSAAAAAVCAAAMLQQLFALLNQGLDALLCASPVGAPSTITHAQWHACMQKG